MTTSLAGIALLCYNHRMGATIGTKIFTFFGGKRVGSDGFGNRYYQARRAKQGNLKKRWVIYNGLADPSKVPPEWHGWLHYTLASPIPDSARRYAWLKPHLPNLTGTIHRYLPQGHLLRKGVRAKATADYQPWQPK